MRKSLSRVCYHAMMTSLPGVTQSDYQNLNGTFSRSGGSKAGARDVPPPPGGTNSLIFIQFRQKNRKIIG